MITVNADIGSSIDRTHYALVPSHEFSFAPVLHESSERLRRDWEHLEPDPYMADGGRYRLRRYGLYQLSATIGQLNFIPDASFYQSTETNPFNGGKHRHFAPLDDDTVKNPFLRELIWFDFAQLTSKKHIEDDWLIGVHQIRILATTGVQGNPTPEVLRQQIRDIRDERKPSYYIPIKSLSQWERQTLAESLKSIAEFRKRVDEELTGVV